jgi:hypothetical protein
MNKDIKRDLWISPWQDIFEISLRYPSDILKRYPDLSECSDISGYLRISQDISGYLFGANSQMVQTELSEKLLLTLRD